MAHLVKYQVILSDPPWSYGSRGARGGKFGDLDYGCMSIKDMCSLDVESIAADVAHLHMWVTSPFMMDAHIVAKAWGFDQFIRVDKVWNKKKDSGKPHGVCGPHGMTDCEFILLFARGGKTTSLYNDSKRNQYASVDAPYTGKHSEKPDLFRKLIDDRYKSGLYKLEMFARYGVHNWFVFGNEAPDSIEIPIKPLTSTKQTVK